MPQTRDSVGSVSREEYGRQRKTMTERHVRLLLWESHSRKRRVRLPARPAATSTAVGVHLWRQVAAFGNCLPAAFATLAYVIG